MKKSALFAVVLAILFAFGCTPRESFTALTNVSSPDESGYCSCEYQGQKRKFLLYVPQSALEDAPLVFMLHGYGHSADGFAQSTGMNETAEKYGYALVYPQGLGDPNDKTSASCWNSGMKDEGNDDVGFLISLANYLQQSYGFDKDATFLAGFSNGAFMSYQIACKAPHTFRAVASVSGTMSTGCWKTRGKTEPVGILQISGTEDDLVHVHPQKSYLLPSIDEVCAYWRENNRLDSESVEQLSEKATLYRYSGKSGEAPFWFVEIEGGKHAWPKKEFSGIDANSIILDYFELYRK